jgi:hypothetical protein
MKVKKFKIPSYLWLHAKTQKRKKSSNILKKWKNLTKREKNTHTHRNSRFCGIAKNVKGA